MSSSEFEIALATNTGGYSEGIFSGTVAGVTLQRSDDGKRISLFAQELGGRDVISFNLYYLSSGEAALKPCEMSDKKVAAFVVKLDKDKSACRKGMT